VAFSPAYIRGLETLEVSITFNYKKGDLFCMKKLLNSILALSLAAAMLFSAFPASLVFAKTHTKDNSFYGWYDKYQQKCKDTDDDDDDDWGDYLVLVGQPNGTYLGYDDIAFFSDGNNIMVKAKLLANALGLTYQNYINYGHHRKKGCTISLNNDTYVYYRNSKTYYFYDYNNITGQTSCIRLTSPHKLSVSENYNALHASTLSNLVNYQYYDTSGVSGYLSLGYRGVLVYNRYSPITALPDLSAVTSVDDSTTGNNTVVNITVKPSIIMNTSYSDINFVEATQSTVQSSAPLIFDLSEVLANFKAYHLPSDGIYGYGCCDTAITLQALDKNGYVIGELKTTGSDFLINFPSAVKLKVTGEVKNMMLDFTPVKPIVITDTTKLAFNQISWLYASDGFARQYFVIADYMSFSLENVFSAYALSRKPLDFKTFNDLDCANSYQRITAVFKSPYTEPTSPYSYINAQKTKKSISNALVLFSDTGTAVLASDYETKLLSMISTLTSNGVNTYYPGANWNRQLVMKLPDSTANTAYNYISLDPSFLNLDYFYDYYIHLHEMTHFYESTQPHYGIRFAAWTDGNATTLAKKTLDTLKIAHTDSTGKDFFDTLYATNYSFLTQDNKNNFEAYYLNASGLNATLIGYHFTDFLQDTYGSDIIYRIMEKVYAANITVTAERNSTYDKQFTDCIKSVTSQNVFQLFVEYCVN